MVKTAYNIWGSSKNDITVFIHQPAKYPGIYTVTFDPNGGTGSVPLFTFTSGESFVLPACFLEAPAGYSFKAWEVNGVEMNPGQTIPADGDKNIRALWVKVKTLSLSGSISSGTVHITIENPDLLTNNASLIVAQYSNGQLNAVKTQRVTDQNTYSLPGFASGNYTYKAFLVKDISFVPLCIKEEF